MAPRSSPRWTASSGRAMPMWPRPSARCSARSASIPSPGPSEVVILADGGNDPAHLALDLLAQAEHDEAAQAILITDDAALADAVAAAVDEALATLPRAAIAGRELAAAWRDHPGARLGRGGGAGQPARARASADHAGGPACAVRAKSAMPGRCSSVATARRRWAITSPGRTMCCRPAAPRALPRACRCTISSSAPPGSALEDRALAAIGPAAVALAEAEGLTAHAAVCRGATAKILTKGSSQLDRNKNSAHSTASIPQFQRFVVERRYDRVQRHGH